MPRNPILHTHNVHSQLNVLYQAQFEPCHIKLRFLKKHLERTWEIREEGVTSAQK